MQSVYQTAPFWTLFRNVHGVAVPKVLFHDLSITIYLSDLFTVFTDNFINARLALA